MIFFPEPDNQKSVRFGTKVHSVRIVLPLPPTAPPEKLNENMPDDLELATWLTAWATSDMGIKTLRQIEQKVEDRVAWLLPLRKMGLSPSQAGAVIELAELRQRAQAKFPVAQQLFFTRRAYEQASGQTLGEWKVQCIRSRWPGLPIVVLDLCCGIGGDLLQFAQAFPTIGLDRDPALVHFAKTNVQVASHGDESANLAPPRIVVADVTSILPPPQHTTAKLENEASQTADEGEAAEDGRIRLRQMSEWIEYLPRDVQRWARQHQLLNHYVVWHLDPDRRDERGRHTRIEDIVPNGDFIEALRCWSPGGLVKLAPGTELSESWEHIAHWQWLGADRECKQLLGLFGFDGSHSVAVFNRKRRQWEVWEPNAVGTADDGRVPECERMVDERMANFLIELHPAFYAARMARRFAGQHQWKLMPGGDYFGCQSLAMDDTEQFSAFRILAVLPLREKLIAQWLREHERGVVEIKSRAVSETARKPLQELVRRFPHWKDQAPVSLLAIQVPKGSGTALRVAICERVVENV